MREILTTCGELLGAALISIGLALISPALGLIAAGVLLVAFCWMAAL